MKTEHLTLPVHRVKIELSPDTKSVGVSPEPRLDKTGDVKVVTVLVHNDDEVKRGFYLSAQVMLDRTASEHPVDNIPDIENILARDLPVDCRWLLTAIKVYDESRRAEGWLYLSRDANGHWGHSFAMKGSNWEFTSDCLVLCYGK